MKIENEVTVKSKANILDDIQTRNTYSFMERSWIQLCFTYPSHLDDLHSVILYIYMICQEFGLESYYPSKYIFDIEPQSCKAKDSSTTSSSSSQPPNFFVPINVILSDTFRENDRYLLNVTRNSLLGEIIYNISLYHMGIQGYNEIGHFTLQYNDIFDANAPLSQLAIIQRKVIHEHMENVLRCLYTMRQRPQKQSLPISITSQHNRW